MANNKNTPTRTPRAFRNKLFAFLFATLRRHLISVIDTACGLAGGPHGSLTVIAGDAPTPSKTYVLTLFGDVKLTGDVERVLTPTRDVPLGTAFAVRNSAGYPIFLAAGAPNDVIEHLPTGRIGPCALHAGSRALLVKVAPAKWCAFAHGLSA